MNMETPAIFTIKVDKYSKKNASNVKGREIIIEGHAF